eukprot:Mycagemm_TRINITY_DN10033_c0_g1::TRINITY_DN10033_c0_g1_i1::g.2273::m.2273 type:complete len:134 gc:universal TRINITY_DN10033_c0_g1_i1:410-9(-)
MNRVEAIDLLIATRRVLVRDAKLEHVDRYMHSSDDALHSQLCPYASLQLKDKAVAGTGGDRREYHMILRLTCAFHDTVDALVDGSVTTDRNDDIVRTQVHGTAQLLRMAAPLELHSVDMYVCLLEQGLSLIHI